MKWIDEKGRLFGKLNLFDLLVILLVVAGLIGMSTRLVTKTATEKQYRSGVSQIEVLNVPEYVADSFKVGDVLYEKEIELGTVTAVEKVPYTSVELLNDGTYQEVEHALNFTVKMTVETDRMLVEDTGINVNTQEWLSGTRHSISNGFTTATAIIRTIDHE